MAILVTNSSLQSRQDQVDNGYPVLFQSRVYNIRQEIWEKQQYYDINENI